MRIVIRSTKALTTLIVLCCLSSTACADLIIDGMNNYAPVDTYTTSDGAYSGYVARGSSSLHLGYEGNDILTGGASHFMVAYFGATGTSTTTGINFNTQQPGLPFNATHAYVYRLDNGYQDFFEYDGSSWSAQGTAGINSTESGTFFEASIDSANLGSPTGNIHFAAYLLFEGAGFESSFAVMPSDSFANGTYDPDLSSFLTITAVPELSSISTLAIGLLPLCCVRRRRP